MLINLHGVDGGEGGTPINNYYGTTDNFIGSSDEVVILGEFSEGDLQITSVEATTNEAETMSFQIGDVEAPIINDIETEHFSWEAYLNLEDSKTDGTVNITTLGVEDGQEITVTLNSKPYTAIV